jgi:hypothetical protein
MVLPCTVEEAVSSVCAVRIASTYFLIAPALLKRSGALEHAIDAGLFEPFLPLPFRPLRLALPLPLFLFRLTHRGQSEVLANLQTVGRFTLAGSASNASSRYNAHNSTKSK